MKTYSDSPPPLGLQHNFPLTARPEIRSNHIDGPLLIFRDGQMHWLTYWERFLVALGQANAESLERKHRPNLMKLLDTKGENMSIFLVGDILEWGEGKNSHRWKVQGVHLGGEGIESLVHLENVSHSPGWTGEWETHHMMYVPECLLRQCKVLR